MESKGTVKNNRFNGEAVITYENGQLIISAKPFWVRILFGILGEALASAKEKCRVNLADVTCLRISETWTGKPVYELTMPYDVCTITFNKKDDMTSVLMYELKDKVCG